MAGTVVLPFFWLMCLQGRVSTRRGMKFQRAAASLLLCITLTLAACSGFSGPDPASVPTSTSSPPPAPTPSPAAGTPAGQYWVTVTAACGTVTESIQLGLSVN